MIDHYRTLGVAASADDAVIRAVYVALMKRFHPDRSTSPEALKEAQAINEAYAVLSDPKRRAAYDEEREELEPWDRGALLPTGKRSGVGAGGTGVLLLALMGAATLFVYWPTLGDTRRGGTVARAPIASAPARCAALADPERIRMALIAHLDQSGALDAAAAGALTAATFELGPASDARDLAAPGETACLATLAITLPAAFRTASGQETILSELQFSASRTDPAARIAIQPDGRLVAALSAIHHRSDVPVAEVSNPMLEADVRIDEQPALPQAADLPPPRSAVPQPSATVREARVAGPAQKAAPLVAQPAPKAANSDGLAGVESQTMGFYAQSLGHATPEKRGRLARSHGAFAARLAACGSDACRRDAYLARSAEISRIMMGE